MIAVSLLGVLVMSTHSLGLYKNHPEVTKLTHDNFDELVANGDDVWLVQFYASWCGYCQQLKSEYLKAAKELKGDVQVGVVDTSNEPTLNHRFSIKFIPTVYIFTPNEKPKVIKSLKHASLVKEALEAKQLYKKKNKRRY